MGKSKTLNHYFLVLSSFSPGQNLFTDYFWWVNAKINRRSLICHMNQAVLTSSFQAETPLYNCIWCDLATSKNISCRYLTFFLSSHTQSFHSSCSFIHYLPLSSITVSAEYKRYYIFSKLLHAFHFYNWLISTLMLEIIENILPEQDDKYLSYNKLIHL